MTEPTTTTLVGVKYSTAIAGFFGSVVALTFAKELTILRLIFAILTGSLTAHYSTNLILHFLQIPMDLNDSVAFLVGLVAMSLIPVLFLAIEKGKERVGDLLQKFLG